MNDVHGNKFRMRLWQSRPTQRVDRWAGGAPDDGRWLTRGRCTLLGDATGKHRDGERPAITGRWRKDMRLLVERGHAAGPTGADHVRTRRGGTETVSHELTEPNAWGICRSRSDPQARCAGVTRWSVGSTASQWEVSLGPLVDIDTMPYRPSGQSRQGIGKVGALDVPGRGALGHIQELDNLGKAQQVSWSHR